MASSSSVVTEHRKRKRTIKTSLHQDTSDSSVDSDEKLENADDQDEPVLSHAQQRRRKKEQKRAEKLKPEDGDARLKKKRKLIDGSSSQNADVPTTKRENSVWAGNLSYKTQHEDLREFFKEAGEITRINMPTKAGGRPGMKPENRGFAYIDFATPEAKVTAVALSEKPLLGRKLLIKDGDNFEGRPASTTIEAIVTDPSIARKTHTKTAQKILSVQKQPPAPTLFFGNLPFQTTEDEIRQLLDAHRPRDKTKDKEIENEGEDKRKDSWIRKIRMGTFEDSGLCKGFAFVDFTSIDNATAALINPRNHHLNGRDLVVEYASPDAVRRGGSKIGGAVPPKRRPLSAGYKKTRGRKEGKAAQDHDSGEKFTVQEHDHTGKDLKEKEKAKLSAAGKFAVADQKGQKSRPKPGAALAQAKRETAVIVPSQGKKIVF